MLPPTPFLSAGWAGLPCPHGVNMGGQQCAGTSASPGPRAKGGTGGIRAGGLGLHLGTAQGSEGTQLPMWVSSRHCPTY